MKLKNPIVAKGRQSGNMLSQENFVTGLGSDMRSRFLSVEVLVAEKAGQDSFITRPKHESLID